MAEKQPILHPTYERPLVTYALFTYNQEEYVSQAIQSALNQSYTPLEIVISDDCSTDSTFEIIKKETKNYTGPHKLIVIKNKSNLGVTSHINNIFNLASGDLIIAAAGDDISVPTRAEQLAKKWIDNGGGTAALYSPWIPIDRLGKKCGPPHSNHANIKRFFTEDKGKHQYHGLIQGACAAWSRDLITNFGNLLPGGLCEDLELSYRAAFFGKILSIDEPLVLYRISENSISNFNKKSNTRKAIEWQEKRIHALDGLLDFITRTIVNEDDRAKISGSIRRLQYKYKIRILLNRLKLVIKPSTSTQEY